MISKIFIVLLTQYLQLNAKKYFNNELFFDLTCNTRKLELCVSKYLIFTKNGTGVGLGEDGLNKQCR